MTTAELHPSDGARLSPARMRSSPSGFGIDDAEEGDTDLFALDNPVEDGGDDAEGDFDDGLGE